MATPASTEATPLLRASQGEEGVVPEGIEVETGRTGAPKDVDGARKVDGPAYVAAVVGLLTLAITTWTVILTHHPSQLGWFAYHPPLQTLAILLFGLGILTLQPTSPADPAGKRAGLARHQILNFGLGLPAIAVGTALMVYNKSSHGAAHFTTWHARFGIATVAWLIAQVLVGALSVWFGGRALGGGDRAKAVYKYHRASGYTLLFFLLLTAHLGGAWSDWVVMSTAAGVRAVGYVLAPVLVLGGVYTRVRTSKMPLW